jgi:hypothetical protein
MINWRFCFLAVLLVTLAAGGAFAATFKSEKGGFSIELPKGWEPLPKEDLEPLANSNVYLVAIDRAALKAGRTLSLTITKADVPASYTVEKLASVPLSGQMAANAKNIKKELKKLGGAEWVINSYTKESGGVTQATVFYSTIASGKLVNLDFSLDKLEGNESLTENAVSSYKAE